MKVSARAKSLLRMIGGMPEVPRRRLRSLLADARGVTAVMMGVAVIPLIGAIGIGTDTTMAYLLKSRLSSAVDAAALAGGRVFFEADRNADVQRFFDANFPAAYMGATVNNFTIVPDAENETLTVQASATMPTVFMHFFGISEITVSTESTVARTTTVLDVVLAVDLSGSMLDPVPGSTTSRIAAAKAAATELVTVLFGTDEAKDFLRVGLVPWAGKVNVADRGTQYGKEYPGGPDLPSGSLYTSVELGQTYNNPYDRDRVYYYDYDKRYPYRVENPESATDFRPTGAPWYTLRRYVLQNWTATYDRVYYAHNSAVPLLTIPPDDWNGCVYGRYARSYDTGDNSPRHPDSSTDLGNAAYDVMGQVADHGAGNLDWMGWMPMGKEGNAVPGHSLGYWLRCDLDRMNNYWDGIAHECTPCPVSGITRLVDSGAEIATGVTQKQTILNAISELQAVSGSYTNIPQGLAWGWRVVSPDIPFTEGTSDPGVERERAVILLTDGANTVRNGDAFNRTQNDEWRRDDMLEDVADAVKGEDIFVYTIQFANSSGDLATLMRNVASEPEAPFYQYAPSEEELSQAFKEIANNLANLHLSK